MNSKEMNFVLKELKNEIARIEQELISANFRITVHDFQILFMGKQANIPKEKIMEFFKQSVELASKKLLLDPAINFEQANAALDDMNATLRMGVPK